jgi:hypothetical protein
MAGSYSCPLGGVLDCSSAGALTLAPDGLVTDFSAPQWNTSSGKWCDGDGLDGGVYAYAGTGSTSTAAVDATARNLKLNFSVVAGNYAGGGVSFDSCVNASTAGFTAVQFTAAITAGSLTGCVWQVQLQTQDQRATTATNPSGGTCASNCYRFPAYAVAGTPSATPMPFVAPFSGFNNPASSTIAAPTQVVGLQWQVNSGNSGTGTCTVELRIDDVKFIMQ